MLVCDSVMILRCYEPPISEEGCMRIRTRILGCTRRCGRVTRYQHQFPEILGELREFSKKGTARWRWGNRNGGERAVGETRGKPVRPGPASGHLWGQMETRKGKRPESRLSGPYAARLPGR